MNDNSDNDVNSNYFLFTNPMLIIVFTYFDPNIKESLVMRLGQPGRAPSRVELEKFKF